MKYLIALLLLFYCTTASAFSINDLHFRSRKGRCKEITAKTVIMAKRNYPVRIGHGYAKEGGKPHRWVEYFTKGKWRVWDEAQKYVGKSWYTAKELGYIVKRYEDCEE